MRNIINSIVFFGIIGGLMYWSFSSKIKEEENKNIDQKISEKYLPNKENLPIKKLNTFENFVANIVVRLAESEKGSDFMLKLIKPLNSPTNEIIAKTNNTFYLNQLFNLQHILYANKQDAKTAFCGAEVIVDYNVKQAETIIESKDGHRMILGNSDIDFLNNIVIGQKEGHILSAKIPHNYAGKKFDSYLQSEEAKLAGLTVEVKLVEVLDNELAQVKIFDNAVSANPVYMCGYPASSMVKISKIDGQIVWEGQISYVLGDRNYPILFSMGLFNKVPEITRTIITPLKNLNSLNKTNLVFDQNQELLKSNDFVLVEFQ